jgi:hypothetical protein
LLRAILSAQLSHPSYIHISGWYLLHVQFSVVG